MPVSYIPQKSSKKKHHSFFGGIAHDIGHVVSGTSKGLYKGVTGFPTGAYMTGRAIGHDVIHDPLRMLSPGYNAYEIFKGKGRTGKIAHSVAQSEYENYHHFGRGGDVSGPLLDALAALSGGGAVVSKGAALGRAVKAGEGLTGASRAILKSTPYSRAIPGTPYRIPASPNPVIRGAQKLSLKNPAIARQAKNRRKWQVERFAQHLEDPVKTSVEKYILPSGRTVTTTTHKVRQAPPKTSLPKKALDLPMNTLRLAMWARLPRFIGQNAAQSAAMLSSRPLSSAESVVKATALRNRNPAIYADLKKLAEGGQARAMQEGTINMGRFMRGLGKMANFPQDQMRVVSILEEMKREGIVTDKQLAGAVKQLKAGKPTNKVLNATIRGHENLGDFGRMSKRERTFTKSQLPIFYPMFKALTRYGYRLPSEHAIQSAAGINLGKQGKTEQHRLLGDLPFWGQYLIPTGAGNPNAKPGPRQAALNPANIYNLQPASDITRQAVGSARPHGSIPGLNLLQELGPFGQIGYGAITGHDIQTGFPLRYMSKKGIQHNYTKTQMEAAVRNFVESLPLSDLARLSVGGKPTLKSYEQSSNTRRVFSELFGPAVVSRVLKTKETQKQAAGEKSYGHGRKKTRHKKTFAPAP